MATPHGPGPTRILFVTLLLAGSIRASVPPPLLPTQTAPKPPTSEHGPLPVWMRATTRAVPVAPDATAAAANETRPTKNIARRFMGDLRCGLGADASASVARC